MPREHFRTFARQLGFKCEDGTGRIKFEKGPAHKLWYGVEQAKDQSFDEIISIIETYGPTVWTDENQSNMYKAGDVKEYPMTLSWPDDKTSIVEIFCNIHEARTKSLTLHKHRSAPPTKQSLKRAISTVSTSTETSFASVAQSKIELDTQDVEGVEDNAERLPKILLWLTTKDSQLSAQMEFGRHDTIESLFAAMEDTFAADNELDIRAQLGAVVGIVMQFSNSEVICINISDTNDKLIGMGKLAADRLEDDREKDVGSVIALTTVFFNKN